MTMPELRELLERATSKELLLDFVCLLVEDCVIAQSDLVKFAAVCLSEQEAKRTAQIDRLARAELPPKKPPHPSIKR
jgi:hypothetical protein